MDSHSMYLLKTYFDVIVDVYCKRNWRSMYSSKDFWNPNVRYKKKLGEYKIIESLSYITWQIVLENN